MSLQRLVMLTAIGHHNRQSSNNNQSNIINGTTHNTLATTIAGMRATATPIPMTTTSSSSSSAPPLSTATSVTTLPLPTKILNSNKSTLIQLKQQQRPDIVLTTTAATTTTLPQTLLTTPPQQRVSTINSTSTVSSPALNPYSRDHIESYGGGVGVGDHQHQHHNHAGVGNNFSDSSEEDNASQSTEDAGHQDEHEVSGRQRPVNTFYGSGFGIFHQQRANMGGTGGGGIALITGHSGSGLGSGGSGGSYSNGINNNVNLLLGGAMLTLITTILCVVCYCCHRNIKKRTEAAYRQQRQWLENDPNMEIYSVEQCYETSGLFVGDSMDGLATIPALHHEPPPSYDAVVAMQEQQQLLMQQQQQHLLMQQLHNSSPPPGYRSSLDVSCILTARAAAALVPSTLGRGSADINSLAASSTNVIVATTRSPPEGNDLNGNREMGPGSSVTSTSSQLQQQPNFLRSMKQRHRNLPTANLANFNMKKVLQAQSCCSLQRAEVENMWNAAAAALAARSTHVTNDPRGTASTSSPTLVMNQRKLSNAPSSKATTPETFGSRYLKQQNYYRRGCPLCGKFRYDNESMLSISIESDLDNVAMAEDNGAGSATNGNSTPLTEYHEDVVNCGLEEGEDDECSCRHTKHRQSTRNAKTTAVVTNRNYDNEASGEDLQGDIELSTAIDLNANCPEARQCVAQTTTSSLSINNNSNSNNNHEDEDEQNEGDHTSQPSTSAEAAAAATTAAATPTNAVAINLDCINENGIVSLDMSKIIDKTGLPTYDAALKLESSGYV